MSSRLPLAICSPVGRVLPPTEDLFRRLLRTLNWRIDPDVPAVLTAASSTVIGSCLVRRASCLISFKIFFRNFFSETIAISRSLNSFTSNFNIARGTSLMKAEAAAIIRLSSAVSLNEVESVSPGSSSPCPVLRFSPTHCASAAAETQASSV
ncbi:MAG: hypothetical protein JW395_3603 [Nitrospira sp.]|nr:hypothetical protein [Nitrospira sp.]